MYANVFTCCQEEDGSGYRVVVGGFDAIGLYVVLRDCYAYGYGDYGLGALRKFCKSDSQ